LTLWGRIRFDLWSRMVTPNQNNGATILLVEADVIVRFALADYLRACGLIVIEAPNGADARAVLVAGPAINVPMSDAQLAGDENGFALAHWVRRHRPNVEVLLMSSLANKAQTASEFCTRYPDRKTSSDSAGLASRIQSMLAERKRRTRSPPSTASVSAKRRRP
jgi:DNA-binding NtrC family response regulator